MPTIRRRLSLYTAPAFAGLLAAALWAPSLASPSHAATTQAAAATPPNIVFVLTDDLAWNLVQYMPQVQQMQQQGVTFTNYNVTDPLCCPSPSSIFTGNFPHDTGVFTNTLPDGGFALFHSRGEE